MDEGEKKTDSNSQTMSLEENKIRIEEEKCEDGFRDRQQDQTTNPTKKLPHCDQCGKDFSTKVNLKVHQLIHTGEKPFLCDTCGKRFRQSTHRLLHRRLHTGEKPYVCDVCGRRFSQKSSVKIHQRLHTGEKPYVCDVCSKSFRHSTSMKHHQCLHKDKTAVTSATRVSDSPSAPPPSDA